MPETGFHRGFQHPDRRMPGQLLRADGSTDSLISQSSWWLCSLGSQRETICSRVGRKAPHQQVAAAEAETQAKHRGGHLHNLCSADPPGTPLARPPRRKRARSGPLGPQPGHTWQGDSQRLSGYLLVYSDLFFFTLKQQFFFVVFCFYVSIVDTQCYIEFRVCPRGFICFCFFQVFRCYERDHSVRKLFCFCLLFWTGKGNNHEFRATYKRPQNQLPLIKMKKNF